MTDYIYNSRGNPVGYIRDKHIYKLIGQAIGQIQGTHVHKLSGSYVGELHKDMVVDKHLGNPGNAGHPGHAGNRSVICYGYRDVSDDLLS